MMMWRNVAIGTVAIAAWSMPVQAEPPKPLSGTVTIDETQFGFLLGGNVGGGTLTFHGKTYPFKVGGISVGDIGASKVRGFGRVYDLGRVADFAGTFTKLDASATLVNGSGALRLKNEHGVVLELDTTSKGLQLSAGAGGVKVTLR